MNYLLPRGVAAAGSLGRLWYPVSDASVTLSGIQAVRWRKPRWVPRAKSKMFLVPTHPSKDPEEMKEIMRLYNHYRSQVKAIRRHLHEESLRTSAASGVAAQLAAEEEADHQRLMEYNARENQRVAALREKRMQEEFEADMMRVAASKVKHEEQAAVKEEEALRIIMETQELVKTFIKREDLESAVEAALANPVDYNTAIDQDGFIYRGRDTNPREVPMEERELMQKVVQ